MTFSKLIFGFGRLAGGVDKVTTVGFGGGASRCVMMAGRVLGRGGGGRLVKTGGGDEDDSKNDCSRARSEKVGLLRGCPVDGRWGNFLEGVPEDAVLGLLEDGEAEAKLLFPRAEVMVFDL
jgi:hypothetical protein